MVSLWSNVSSSSRLSSNIYSQIAPWACRKLVIICYFLKADTTLTAEGDRMKETAQTFHTVQHEGPPVTAISKCEPFHPKFCSQLLLEKKTHTLLPRNKRKRPGSHGIPGGHVVNGQRFLQGPTISMQGIQGNKHLTPSYLERPYSNHSSKILLLHSLHLELINLIIT